MYVTPLYFYSDNSDTDTYFIITFVCFNLSIYSIFCVRIILWSKCVSHQLLNLNTLGIDTIVLQV